MRTELEKTRTEQAETRTEQAEMRAEQAEMAVHSVVHDVADLRKISQPHVEELSLNRIADQKNSLEVLTGRQRQVLQLIAEGQNTKQIAGILKVSPKTVEYHRLKLMDGLNAVQPGSFPIRMPVVVADKIVISVRGCRNCSRGLAVGGS
jgi:DNA-binding NarL/FixJ family response regulator